MKTCETCLHHLGGGQCRLNLERECADGGYECWEAGTLAALGYGVCVEV